LARSPSTSTTPTPSTSTCTGAEWAKGVRSTLACLPTGTGKGSIIAQLVADNAPGRTLILVHKRELVFQMVKRLELYGVTAEIEMADLRAATGLWGRATCVVATVQTLNSGKDEKRHQRFNPADFSLLIHDESHHCTAASWKTIIKHFLAKNQNLRACGFTATPDRADGEALRQVCDSVACNIPILEMIEAGWLVDIDQKVVRIESLQFDKCRETAGDLNGADLDRPAFRLRWP
jgi:superfamily II DNA or RNA helicase